MVESRFDQGPKNRVKKQKKTKLKYPLCRPTVKVTKDTPKLAKDIDQKEIDRANKEKQKVQHKGRIKFGKKR